MSNAPSRRWTLLVITLVVATILFWRGEPKFRHRTDAVADGETLPTITSATTGARGIESAPRISQQTSSRLFTFVQLTDSERSALGAASPAPAREIHYVHVNRELVTGKRSPFWQKPGADAGRFELPLSDDGMSVTVAIDHSEMLGPDRFTSIGQIEGHAQSRALFAWNAGFLHASFEDPQLGHFALRVATENVSQFYQIDPALVPACAGERRLPRAAMGARASSPQVPTEAGASPALSLTLENPQAAEIHVMMVYTQAVLTTLSGTARTAALQSAFDLAIAKTNVAFEASLITARMKLVRIVETQYDETVSTFNKVQDDALTALYKTDDGKMDELHALRDAAGADVVMLALGRPDSATSGLSFLLDEPGGFDNANYAFSVVQYSAIAGTNVVPHELGHVLGCAHDRENALSGPGAYSYSYGYRFFGADGRQYHDIMSYPPGMELSYFSNPNVVLPLPVSVPIGIAAGRPGESNTALTIEKNAFATANYRLQTQAPPAAGTLINVATRAFVGTGDQVLIGGFVVEGTQPKSLLIRAAGPSLASFGVRDVLADPVLRVYARGALAAENDNWSLIIGSDRPLAADALLSAVSQVHAFPFSIGSADAAMLVILPPGAYSAVVEGARGTTGNGMVEAYEVERDSDRVVTLATRGFVSREKEMYGGFVVQGVPGTTKRILIRVLGPTLARPPFNFSNALEDPEMELHNAAGDLLIANDDWSSGVESHESASPENDFKPLVESYSEAQIFATGYAPANRREPCIMADLPPGNYTVTVRPFESHSSDSVAEQPAVSGVGVMEVYEIAK